MVDKYRGRHTHQPLASTCREKREEGGWKRKRERGEGRGRKEKIARMEVSAETHKVAKEPKINKSGVRGPK